MIITLQQDQALKGYRLPANLWEEQGAAPVSDVLVMRRRG